MSKRAGEKALEIFPSTEREYKSVFGTFHFDDINVEHREGFIVGYEQAQKDTIERACKWLFAHLPILIDYYTDAIHTNADRSEFIRLFRTQMEDKK